MKFQIIDAKKEHINSIASFQVKMAWETENVKLKEETVLKGVTSVFEHTELGRYFVVQNQEKTIASLLITYEWSDWRNAKVWWIQSVYVLPEFRRKGIFKQLYAHIQSIVEKDENIGGVRLYVDKTNKNAQKTYEKVGMNGEHYQLFEWMKD
jgi:ribosomal protein S18 acetylase RimI-like enzyme